MFASFLQDHAPPSGAVSRSSLFAVLLVALLFLSRKEA